MSGAASRIARVASRPVRRGILTSRIARSGCSLIAMSRASIPSEASAITSMSSWRSSSMRSPERTIPWSSAISTRMDSYSQADARPDGRFGLDLELASDQQRPLPHPGDPEPAVRLAEHEAVPVVAHAQLQAVAVAAQAHPDVLGARMADHVRERLLGDPIGDELDLRPDIREIALGVEARLDAGLVSEFFDRSGERRLQPHVVEHRGAQGASQVEQLPHRLVGHHLGFDELPVELRRRLVARRLEVQQHAGQRLVDLVVEVARHPGALLLHRLECRARGTPALRVEPLQHAPERDLEALDLLGLRSTVHQSAEVDAGARQVGLLHRLDESLQRLEALLDHEQVDEDRQGDREPEDEADRGVVAKAAVRVGGHPGRDHGDRYQQQVGDQDSGEERSATHQSPKYRHPEGGWLSRGGPGAIIFVATYPQESAFDDDNETIQLRRDAQDDRPARLP